MNKILITALGALVLSACQKTNQEVFDKAVRDARTQSPAASQPVVPASAAPSSSKAQAKFDEMLRQAKNKP